MKEPENLPIMSIDLIWVLLPGPDSAHVREFILYIILRVDDCLKQINTQEPIDQFPNGVYSIFINDKM